MRIFLTLLAFVSLFLFSCQKEADFANRNNSGGGGSNTSGTMLVKTVEKSGSDSTVTVYTYNANKKLVNEKIVGTDQGTDVSNEYRYYRNTSGIITHYVQINPELVAVGIDSVTTIVHYNSSSSRYTSTVMEISIPGFSLLDSTVFIYDASGKIIREDFYEGLTGVSGYYLSGKLNFSYSANGNISQVEIIDIDAGGTQTPVGTTAYTYDTKTSAIHFDNEAFAIGHPEWISANNPTNGQLTDASDPSNNQTITFSYTYNSNNKPATSITKILPDNVTINTTYFYQ